ncbi:RHS repeat-associated core domain-containing protein, partial [Pseudomonas sp. Q1]|uniref:RHS repeat-associated core domain-containing protein n=1 Tax=Pseudomonas sp. Q1 TaxID=2202823 RepID=UPI001374A03F
APYGGTTGCDEAATEVSRLAQRTRRYSGKELDATGLYYYGWRYYQPALGRWLSADPGGLVDGVNLFRFCTNNSINRTDWDGRMPPPLVPRPESRLSAASTFLPISPKSEVVQKEQGIAKLATSARPLNEWYQDVLRPSTVKGGTADPERVNVLNKVLQNKIRDIDGLTTSVYNKLLPQLELPDEFVYRLRVIEEDAYILEPVSIKMPPKIPAGRLSYVVREADPLSVYAFMHDDIERSSALVEMVTPIFNFGHSSLTFDAQGFRNKFKKPSTMSERQHFARSAHPVLLAGHLYFPEDDNPLTGGGTLRYWDNDSGHFKPTEEDSIKNRVGVVREVLPTRKFRLFVHDI